MFLSLTSIIFHPVCQLQCARPRWKNDLWQWPEASREWCSWAPAIRNVCVPRSGEGSSMWSFTHSAESESFLCMSVCVSVLHCSHVTEHSMEAFWHSQVCTSPVTLAEWQKGANGCCYTRVPEHLLRVTPLFHCHLARLTALARVPCYFSFSLQTCTWWMPFSVWTDEWFMLRKVRIAAF